MKFTTYSTLFTLVFFLPLFNSCYPKMIYCGANKSDPKFVYKAPNDRYKDTEKSFGLKNKSTLALSNALDNKAQVTNELSLSNSITKLRDNLNNNSIRFSELLYRSAEAYNQNVCSVSAEKRYQGLLDSTANYLVKIAEIELKLETAIGATNLGGGNTDSLKIAINEFSDKVFFPRSN